jgi:hypothetical protein
MYQIFLGFLRVEGHAVPALFPLVSRRPVPTPVPKPLRRIRQQGLLVFLCQLIPTGFDWLRLVSSQLTQQGERLLSLGSEVVLLFPIGCMQPHRLAEVLSAGQAFARSNPELMLRRVMSMTLRLSATVSPTGSAFPGAGVAAPASLKLLADNPMSSPWRGWA